MHFIYVWKSKNIISRVIVSQSECTAWIEVVVTERESQLLMFSRQKRVYQNLVLAVTFNCSSLVISFGKWVLKFEILN
jgi:hypothetical protein